MADTLIVYDSFAGSGNLQDRTPDVGISWAKVQDTSPTTNFILSDGGIVGSAIRPSAGLMYACDPASSIAGMAADCKYPVRAVGAMGTDDPMGLFLRYQDTDNFYAFFIYSASSGNTHSCRVSKKVAGTITELKTANLTVNDNDKFRFQIIGSTYKVFQNDVEVTALGGTDTSISAAGKGGVWAGNSATAFAGADIGNVWKIDEFHLFETDGFVPPVSATDVDSAEVSSESDKVAVTAAADPAEHSYEADQAGVTAGADISEVKYESDLTGITVSANDAEAAYEADQAQAVLETEVQDAELGFEADSVPAIAGAADAESAWEVDSVRVGAVAVQSVEFSLETDQAGIGRVYIPLPASYVINDMKTQAGIGPLGTSASYEKKSYGAAIVKTANDSIVKGTETWQSL